MSLQVLTLISPTFRSSEQPNDRLLEKVSESLRYFLLRLVSCRHRQLGRPFTHDGRSYRSCANCGMRREFDPKTWQTKGRYYHEGVGKNHKLH